MSKNIPSRLRLEFMAHMEAHDFDDFSDGAWFVTLEQAADQFIEKHKLKWIDCNDAAHYYLKNRKDTK